MCLCAFVCVCVSECVRIRIGDLMMFAAWRCVLPSEMCLCQHFPFLHSVA